jgi:hypothetical protein
MNLEHERLKESSSRSAGMKNKEYEMRFETLRVQATEAAKQAKFSNILQIGALFLQLSLS